MERRRESAGANVACPTIRTTNDMPIVEPSSFQALDLVPFQINPHYTEERIPNHGGETRMERLLEFVAANPDMPVIALPESSMLEVRDSAVKLVGSQAATVLRSGQEPSSVVPGPVALA
jgi:dipeptidase E